MSIMEPIAVIAAIITIVSSGIEIFNFIEERTKKTQKKRSQKSDSLGEVEVPLKPNE